MSYFHSAAWKESGTVNMLIAFTLWLNRSREAMKPSNPGEAPKERLKLKDV
jgi:hypothetical protein